MQQDIVSIIFYRVMASIISPLMISLPFFLYWKYKRKKIVTDKAVFLGNFVIPLFISVVYIAILFYNGATNVLLITLLFAVGQLLVSIPISLVVAYINLKITKAVFYLLEHKRRSPNISWTAFLVVLGLIVVFFPKSQEHIIAWTTDSPPLPATQRRCFCAGVSTKAFLPHGDHQLCIGLTYQCRDFEIMQDPER